MDVKAGLRIAYSRHKTLRIYLNTNVYSEMPNTECTKTNLCQNPNQTNCLNTKQVWYLGIHCTFGITHFKFSTFQTFRVLALWRSTWQNNFAVTPLFTSTIRYSRKWTTRTSIQTRRTDFWRQSVDVSNVLPFLDRNVKNYLILNF